MICSGDQEDSCFDDASCAGNEKCCHDGCRKLCVKPLPKPNADPPLKTITRKQYSQTDTSVRRTPCGGPVRFRFQSFYCNLTPYKTDTSLRRTVGAGSDGVRLIDS